VLDLDGVVIESESVEGRVDLIEKGQIADIALV
jgi:hypothetical protein